MTAQLSWAGAMGLQALGLSWQQKQRQRSPGLMAVPADAAPAQMAMRQPLAARGRRAFAGQHAVLWQLTPTLTPIMPDWASSMRQLQRGRWRQYGCVTQTVGSFRSLRQHRPGCPATHGGRWQSLPRSSSPTHVLAPTKVNSRHCSSANEVP